MSHDKISLRAHRSMFLNKLRSVLTHSQATEELLFENSIHGLWIAFEAHLSGTLWHAATNTCSAVSRVSLWFPQISLSSPRSRQEIARDHVTLINVCLQHKCEDILAPQTFGEMVYRCIAWGAVKKTIHHRKIQRWKARWWNLQRYQVSWPKKLLFNKSYDSISAATVLGYHLEIYVGAAVIRKIVVSVQDFLVFKCLVGWENIKKQTTVFKLT